MNLKYCVYDCYDLCFRLVEAAAMRMQSLIQGGKKQHEAWNGSSVQLLWAAKVNRVKGLRQEASMKDPHMSTVYKLIFTDLIFRINFSLWRYNFAISKSAWCSNIRKDPTVSNNLYSLFFYTSKINCTLKLDPLEYNLQTSIFFSLMYNYILFTGPLSSVLCKELCRCHSGKIFILQNSHSDEVCLSTIWCSWYTGKSWWIYAGKGPFQNIISNFLSLCIISKHNMEAFKWCMYVVIYRLRYKFSKMINTDSVRLLFSEGIIAAK